MAERKKIQRLWEPKGHTQVVSFLRKVSEADEENRRWCTCDPDSLAYDPRVPSWLCRHLDCFAADIGACEEKRSWAPGPGTCSCMFTAYLPEDGPCGEPPSRPIRLLKRSQRVAHFAEVCEAERVDPWVLWEGEGPGERAMWARMDFVGPPRLLS
jgi:hypothetical protein